MDGGIQILLNSAAMPRSPELEHRVAIPDPPHRSAPVNLEMTKQGFDICKKYLGGTWKKCAFQDFNMEQIL